jgi:hypothetical protein
MTRALTLHGAFLLAICACAAPAGAQWLKTPTPGIPRTPDGKVDLAAPAPKTWDGRPDLSGVWRMDPGGYGLNLLSQLKAEEIMPWAAEIAAKRKEEFGRDHPAYKCMPEIGPLATFFGMFKILQTPTTTAFLPEGAPYRQVLTDGRALPEDPQPTWMGYSVGRWDGDTFIVESAGFNDRTWLDFDGHPHTEALRVTERYRRPDFGHMRVEMTFEDRKAYTRPWTIRLEAVYAADTELLENVCNENEKSLQHFVVTEEDRKKSRGVKVPIEVLSKYVGVYEGNDPSRDNRPMTFTVTLSGDQLTVTPSDGGGFVLASESETKFSASGAPVIFKVDAAGHGTEFVVHTVEGDLTFKRKK